MSDVNKGPVKKRISDRIKAGKIQQRLQRFVLSTPDDPNYAKDEMNAHQVSAARVLLAKVVPDLKQVEFNGNVKHDHGELSETERSARIAAILDEAGKRGT